MTKLHITNDAEVADITLKTRWEHWDASNWVTSQYWRWHGGDAIVAPTRGAMAWVTIRTGRIVKVVEASSLNHAMEQVGLNPKMFQVA